MMNTYDAKPERRNTMTTVFLVAILILIAIIIYLMSVGAGNKNTSVTARGVMSPDAITDVTDSDNISSVSDVDAPNDGLGAPTRIQNGQLDDVGAGIANVATFERDINNDGKKDRITRTRVETGTAHGYDEYKIEINQNGKFVDITPGELRTVSGAECILQAVRFDFKSGFQLTKISRPVGDTWITPTVAVKTTYAIDNNKMRAIKSDSTRPVCDVTQLF